MIVVGLVAMLGAFTMALSGCGDGTGVCTGCCGPSGTTYCKDGWTEDECADWDAEGVNGVEWNFYEGQTCEERGTPPTP
jgi:hypothetical protein